VDEDTSISVPSSYSMLIFLGKDIEIASSIALVSVLSIRSNNSTDYLSYLASA